MQLVGVEDGYGLDGMFGMTPKELVYLLRSKTAVGSTRALFGSQNPSPHVSLHLITAKSESIDLTLDFRYFAPDELVDEDGVIDVDEIPGMFDVTATEKEKAKKLRHRFVRKIDHYTTPNGRRIDYYVLMAHSRDCWRDISKEITGEAANDEENPPACKAGIYVATRGMPTGIDVIQPQTGQASYWPLFYMVMNDDTLEFDLGRKYIAPRTREVFRKVAKDQFNELVKWIRLTADDAHVRTKMPWIQRHQKDQGFRELENLNEIGLSSLGFKKTPDEQEAAVAAIFHELVGAGLLRGYQGLQSGYRRTYDLWALYQANNDTLGQNLRGDPDNHRRDLPIIIEFKYKGESIWQDIMDETKYFSDIDLIVCWDLSIDKFNGLATVPQVRPEDAYFYGTNYIVRPLGAFNLGDREWPVISLRRLIDDLKAGQ